MKGKPKGSSAWKVRTKSVPSDLLHALPGFKNPLEMQLARERPVFGLRVDASFPPTKVSVDWRSTGAVPTLRSQGSCNACSSFAVVTTIETLHFLKTHERIQLAPGFIHSCLLNRTCSDGASATEVLDAASAHGIAYGFPGDYPYPANACATSNLYPIHQRVFLAGPNQAMQIIANQGPVVGDMVIDPSFMHLAPNDIYRVSDSPDQRLHTLSVVGYDTAQGYWIVANSFGPDWCDHGFGRVAFGEGGLMDERGGWQVIL